MRTRVGLFVAAALILVLQSPALAQQSQPTSWRLSFEDASGNPSTVGPMTFGLASLACDVDLPPAPSTPPVNPDTVYFTDPARPGRACRYQAVAPDPLLALPLGTGWRGRLVAINEAGESEPSAPSNPFDRLGPPSVPTGLVIVR